MILAIRIDDGNRDILDYFLLSPNDLPPNGRIHFRETDKWKLDPYRVVNPSDLCSRLRRALLLKVLGIAQGGYQ